MKVRISFVVAIFSLILTVSLLISQRNVLAAFLALGPATSFNDYSRLVNKKDRTDKFLKESPKSKSMLWKQHLSYYETKLELNAKQREFLSRTKDFLSESFFASQIQSSESEFISTESGRPLKELMLEATNLFSEDQRRQLFSVVGDVSTIEDWGCGANGSNGLRENTAVVSCGCAPSFCWQCSDGFQCTGTNQCPATPDGCGCFGHFACTHICEKG